VISNIFNSKGIHVGTVTSAAILTRYLVRMGSKNWMVWDRQARAPARLGEMGRPAIDLTEEQAREIRDELTKNHIADGGLGLKAKR
jgi:hypothetical protein